MKKRIALLGASGSIGQQTIDVISQHPDLFELVSFGVGRRIEEARGILEQFDVPVFAVQREEDAELLAKEYPDIASDSVIIDALCMKLVTDPEPFDVLVTENLYGDIISDLCAGLAGGLGFAPSANIGDDVVIYEAVHGSAPDIAGQNKANPTALLMAFAMLLNDHGMKDKADRLNKAIAEVIEEGKIVTADIGGTAGTKEFTAAVIARLS